MNDDVVGRQTVDGAAGIDVVPGDTGSVGDSSGSQRRNSSMSIGAKRATPGEASAARSMWASMAQIPSRHCRQKSIRMRKNQQRPGLF